MNDFIEFVTWPTHQNLFHRIRTQALVFYVKGQESAAIGLSARPGKDCRYWIVLHQVKCWMLRHGKRVCTTPTQNILSVSEYRRFWISWYGNVLKLGQNENAEAILSRKVKKMNLKYVTFSVVGETNELYWKCHISQPIKNITLAKLNEGKAYWVKVDNQLPDDIVIGGFVYCTVLCGYNMIWKKTIGNIIPSGSVKGGYSEVNHEILYVGRAYHNGHVIPGKVQPSQNVCCFSYANSEEITNKYEILVYPHPCQSAGDYYVTFFSYTYLEGESSRSSSSSED